MYQMFVDNVIHSSLNVFNNIEELIYFFVSCKHQTHYPLSRPISITFKCIKIIKANSYLYSVSRHDDFYVVWMYEKVYCFSIMLFRCLTDTHYFWGQIKKKICVLIYTSCCYRKTISWGDIKTLLNHEQIDYFFMNITFYFTCWWIVSYKDNDNFLLQLHMLLRWIKYYQCSKK